MRVSISSRASGVLGRQVPEAGAEPVEVVFSNPDKLFSNDFPTPRFGQGAFQVALRALLDQVAIFQLSPPFVLIQDRIFLLPNVG